VISGLTSAYVTHHRHRAHECRRAETPSGCESPPNVIAISERDERGAIVPSGGCVLNERNGDVDEAGA